MNKQIRNIIISLIVIVLLGVGFFLLTKYVFPNDSDITDVTASSGVTEVSTTGQVYDPSEGIYLTQGESANISSIEIKNANSEFVLVQPEKNVWCIEGYENLLPNDSLEYIVDSMANFRCAEIVEENCTDFSKYGLDNPEITAHGIFRDGSEMTVYFGNKKNDETKSRYLYIKNGTTVYLESVGLSTAYAYSIEELISTKMLSPLLTSEDGSTTYKTYDYIELGGNMRSQTVRFEPNKLYDEKKSGNEIFADSKYILTQPISAPLDTSTTGKVARAYTRLTEIGMDASAIEMVLPTEEQLTEYGFDDPAYTITMLCDGTTYEFFFTKFDTVNKFYYAINGARDVIYRFTATAAQWIIADIDKFVPNHLYESNPTIVDKVTVKVDGVTTTFDLTHSDGTYTVLTNTGKQIQRNPFMVFFSQLCSAEWIDVAETIPTIGGSDTVFDITIVYNSELGYANDTISFTKSGVRRYMIALNGNGYFNCEPSVVEAILSAYKSMLEQ